MQYVSYSWAHDVVFYFEDQLTVATVRRDCSPQNHHAHDATHDGFQACPWVVTGRTLLAMHPWMLLILWGYRS